MEAPPALLGTFGPARPGDRRGVSERREQGGGEPPAIFSSHPLDQQRLQAITDTVREHGWRADGPITALPAAYAEWLRDAARRHDKPAD